LTKRNQVFIAAFIILAFAISPAFSESKLLKYKIGSPNPLWVNQNLKRLSIRDKIAQLIQIRVQGKFVNRQDSDFLALKEQVIRNRIGGIVLFAGNVYESAVLLNELQTASRLPLLVAADFERGAAFRIADTTSFPWTMAVGATGSERFAYQEGSITAQESRAMGVHWIYAPVLDVNNNPENPVINIRSYGEDPQLVARLGSAFIRGAHDGGVLTTAKHFPGHGDTATDSHLGLAIVRSNLARLESVELLPFKSAISAGVDSIMTAHVAVPEVTGSPETPATLSEKILTDLLRKSLNFSGIVVTDALEMGGVSNRYWSGLAAVKAVQAGADVLVLPLNVAAAIDEIERAVKRGLIPESRINRSVEKILKAKSSLGLDRNRIASIGQIGVTVSKPQSVKLAQEIADRSITAVKDEQHLLPIDPLKDRRILSLVLSSDTESNPLSIFQAELRRRFTSIRTMWSDARLSEELANEIEKAAAESDLILCSTVVRLSSGQPAASFPKKQRELIEKLFASKKSIVWTAFGNPYVYRVAPQAGTYLCTFSYSDTSQIAAAKALSGEIPIQGKMPASIPPFFNYGDGLQIPRIDRTLGTSAPAARQEPFEESKQLVSSLIASGTIPGAAIIIGQNNSIIWEHYAGKLGVVNVSWKSTYDLSSLSGVVGTTSAAMMSMASKDLILSAPVRDYLPESSLIDPPTLSIKELLMRYSASATDSDMILLNEIVSRASGISLDRFLATRLFVPLGMKNSSFKPLRSVAIHSSARDLAVVAQMLLNGGIYDYKRYFDRSILSQFTGAHAMGWSKPSLTGWTDKLFSLNAFGHNASSGNALWIDPEKHFFIVFLTNAQDKQKASDAQRAILESLIRALNYTEP
jgi:beta-glucosidase-like glycosyl hydrolase/CubicO group peptidase (beta-lactamase class C family)